MSDSLLSSQPNAIFRYVQTQKPYVNPVKPTSGQNDRKEIFDRTTTPTTTTLEIIMEMMMTTIIMPNLHFNEKLQQFLKEQKIG